MLPPVPPLSYHTYERWTPISERAVLIGDWEYGFFSMTAVGAALLGSIVIGFDKELQTNSLKEKRSLACYFEKFYVPDVKLEKGEEMGSFRLGSSIVLLFEAPEEFEWQVQNGQRVRMGECLGSCE
jgi:phosphatidylserine decarboxylase